MKRWVSVIVMGMLLLISIPIDLARATDQNKAAPKPIGHLFLIMMENTSDETLIGNSNTPWIDSAVSLYGVATRYYGITHPSQPNYIAITSGSTHGVTDNNDVTLDVRNLVDQLEAAGKTWKAYQQSLSLCGGNKLAKACGDQQYERKHNPFVSYRNVQTNPARMANIVDLSTFDTDLSSGNVADFSWITPDQCNDMHGHSGPKSDPCSYDNRPQLLAAGDAFLKSWVGKIMASNAWTENSVIFITWDESDGSLMESILRCCNGDPGGGHVLTLVISQSNPSARRSNTVYTHYSLLATIEESWGLGCLANTCDADVARMFDLVNRPH